MIQQMKILVAVKRVIDPYVKVRVNADNTGVVTQNVKMAMNPFDEIAIEEALRFKEKSTAEVEVVLLSIGTEMSQETLRHGLALGADRAILMQSEHQHSALTIAKILQKLVERETPDLMILGKQAIDGDNNQTGQMLAGLLGWAQGTFISQLDFNEQDTTSICIEREIDGGLEKLQLKLPVVLTTDLRLNTPRYASLPNIMKLKNKPMKILPVEELLDLAEEQLQVTKVEPPLLREAGEILANVDELLDKLKNEKQVI